MPGQGDDGPRIVSRGAVRYAEKPADRLEAILGRVAWYAGMYLVLSMPVHASIAWAAHVTSVAAIVVTQFVAIVLLIVAVLSLAMVRTVRSIQPRLVELLAAVGTLSLLLALCLPESRNGEPPAMAATWGWVVGIMACVGFGSIWGWKTAARIAEERTGHRLLLLAAGWGFGPGILALAYALIYAIVPAVLWGPGPIAGVLLAVPGFVIDSRCRRR